MKIKDFITTATINFLIIASLAINGFTNGADSFDQSINMPAEPGDLLYASHIRWWYGGLRSVHIKAGPPAGSDHNELILISPEDAATAHFAEGQQVVIEKIM